MCQTDAVTPSTRSALRLPFVELSLSMPSQLEAISPVVERLLSFIAQFLPSDGDEMDDIELALKEAIVNAVVHGNGEDPEKHVYLTCQCNLDREVSITIQDEGGGFDYNTIPDPTAPENRLSIHGRGIYLMKRIMDKVWFERGGSAVLMRKKSKGG